MTAQFDLRRAAVSFVAALFTAALAVGAAVPFAPIA